MIRVFPQLSTGAVSQYPVKKITAYRTIANLMDDGSRVSLADANAAAIRWEMAYAGLSDAESGALLAFFENVEGRLQSFTFCDPVGNLLGWSETLTAAAWQRNGLLAVSAGTSDPLGTQRASTVTNEGAAALAIGQELETPGTLTTCWSVWARSSDATTIQMERTSGGETATAAGRTESEWRRFQLSSAIANGDTSVFQLRLPAGASVDLFGFQVDAQPAPSQYVETPADGGVYPSARFDMDEIMFIRTGPNQNACAPRFMARVNG